jgi:isoleucyl-tRNA synthetase
MTYLQSILARVLSLGDAMLAIWTTTPTLTSNAGACSSAALNVCLNSCGESLVQLLVDHRWLDIMHEVTEMLALTAGSY